MTHRLVISKVAGLLLLVLVAALPSAYAQSLGEQQCGALRVGRQYGPFDYRTDKPLLGIVERAHFTAAVDTLIRGTQNVLPGGDIDYTLRAFPNHHRALDAMVRYGEKMKSPHPPGAEYNVECYFNRATRFRPDDIIVRMMYAGYLSKQSRQAEALAQLEVANNLAKDDPLSHYNIGLVYFDLKEYDKALGQAHQAMALGHPQTQLREQLEKVGRWKEPAATPPDTTSAPARDKAPADDKTPAATTPEAPAAPATP